MPMYDLEAKNETRGMMKSSYGDEKMDKSTELNESMSISNSSADEYTRKIMNIGGSN